MLTTYTKQLPKYKYKIYRQGLCRVLNLQKVKKSMASSSSLLKLARSLSRIPGLPSRANAGVGCCWRGFATYELSDNDSEDDIAQETKNTTQNNDGNSNGGSKFNNRTVQYNYNGSLYRAIILGEVGQLPIQKRLRNGQMVTIFSVGTGGIRNNRRPLESESPREYADRGIVQWHRVSIYTENLGVVAMQHLKQGAHVYMEGNLETKIFTDPLTGVVKRIREIAIRQQGRLIFLNDGTETNTNSQSLKGVGYF